MYSVYGMTSSLYVEPEFAARACLQILDCEQEFILPVVVACILFVQFEEIRGDLHGWANLKSTTLEVYSLEV